MKTPKIDKEEGYEAIYAKLRKLANETKTTIITATQKSARGSCSKTIRFKDTSESKLFIMDYLGK